MSENFTPGPWEKDASHCRTAVNSVATANNERKHIAMINIAKNQYYEITAEEHDANAYLIAAAPDMYEVLSELEESSSYWSEYDMPIGIAARIMAALKKARGE